MPSSSPKQHRLMEAAKHDKSFAEKVGVPQAVAREFVSADEKAERRDGKKQSWPMPSGYGR